MKSAWRIALPFISAAAAVVIDIGLEDSSKQPGAAHPYFLWLLIAIALLYAAAVVIGLKKAEVLKSAAYKGPFIAGVLLFMNVLNLVTAKLALLPTLYFPTLDRVFGTIIEDRVLIIKCVGYSLRILSTGVIGGVLVGFCTGTAVGFSKRVTYWVMPIVRILGPIPSTAWIPIVLIAFPSARSASAFLIGLAVWFPITVMTSSGISNVSNLYFEVSSTLGANLFWRIFRVGIPASMPHIFLGLFNGICSSFITLMTAEMIGAKYGIGWYVNWQKEMMAYANVYAGLIVIAFLFYAIVTLLFKLRDRLLSWQKGVIKW